MQLMKEIAQARVFATCDRNRLEPAMCRGRTQSIPADMEYDMQGMRWQDQVYQNNRKIDRALNRVHRHARPWPNIDVAVVKGMEIFVHPFPVQDPVDNIEMRTIPEWDQDKQRDEPDRPVVPTPLWDYSLRPHPEEAALINGPDCQAGGK